MHPAEIKAEIEKKGLTQTAIAARVPGGQCTDAAVSMVIRGRSTSERIAREISRRVGIPVSRLWPGRYPRLELEELRRAAA